MVEFNLADVYDAIVRAAPERDAFVFRDLRFTHRQLCDRARRLANVLHAHGFGAHTDRSRLSPWQSGQDHLALYLYNGNEYLEGTFGAWDARLASVNVNYRYVDDELVHVLASSAARAIVYHAAFASRLAAIRDRLPALELLLQVADDSGNPLLPGALDYETALAGSTAERLSLPRSPDDLGIVFTGGTTGLPKGVLWRGADLFVAAMGGRRQPERTEYESLDDITTVVREATGVRALIGPPLMHSAALWSSFIFMLRGGCIVLPDVVDHFDADAFVTAIAEHRITHLTLVGDAFARPMLDSLAAKPADLSSVTYVANGGAPLSAVNKHALLLQFPNAVLADGIGSSETGGQAVNTSTPGTATSSGRFVLNPTACIVSDDRTRVLTPDDDEVGWLAQRGRVPLGYLDDADATARTFPTIEGERFSVPGDRARYRPDGEIDVLGRDSVTINSGGEKIFAEEVEAAVARHPAVYDVVVAGRPSDRWGEEVVAVVALRSGATATEEELRSEAGAYIARFKLPKRFVFVPAVVRSPSGKADYRWARRVARGAP
jgi:3-oxocholest-4-en-26-oate---CoA ligase